MMLDHEYKTRCNGFDSEAVAKFTLVSCKKGDYIQSIDIDFFHLVFILEGKVEFSSGNMLRRCFEKGSFFFLLRSMDIYGYAVEDSRILVLSFDTEVNLPCENCSLYSFLKGVDVKYIDFQSLQVTPQVKMFQDLMVSYLSSPFIEPCGYLYALKQREFFILLTYNYTKKELAEFFSPILNYNTTFKQHFLATYKAGQSIAETASKMNMSLRNFSRKFCVEFGENARDWLLGQKAKSIKIKLSMPNVTINDIVMQYDFTDPSHFTKFCKHYYGCTPTELIRQLRNQDTEAVSR